MPTYKTGDTPGTANPKNLYDDAQDLDLLMTGRKGSYPNRLDKTLLSWSGIQSKISQAIANSGYTVVGRYEDGIQTLSNYNEILEYNGEFYKLKPSVVPPLTTTGTTSATWVNDSSSLVSVGDASLRGDLGQGGEILRGVFAKISGVSAIDLLTNDSESTGSGIFYSPSDNLFYTSNKIIEGAISNLSINGEETSGQINGTDVTFSPYILNGFLSLNTMGIDASGGSDATTALNSAFELSRITKAPIKNSSGTFLLNSSTSLNISHDADLSGCVFKIGANFTGTINIIRENEVISYDSSSDLVKKIVASGVTIPSGSDYWSMLADDTTLNGKFVKITSSEPYYTYRGTVFSRVEQNLVYNKGRMQSGAATSFNTALITNIDAITPSDSYLTIKGLTVDLTESTELLTLLVSHSNKVRVEDFNVKSDTVTGQVRVVWKAQDCYDITVNGFLFNSAYSPDPNQTSETYSYSFNPDSCYDVKMIDVRSDGYGWGQTSFTDCSRLYFDRVTLNRIDTHKPARTFIKVVDSELGDDGLVVACLGDVILDNVTFMAQPNSVVPKPRVLETRGDCGGFITGTLKMSNIHIKGYSETVYEHLIKMSNSATSVVPSGSSIPLYLIKNIKLSNITSDDAISFESVIKSSVSTGNSVMPPVEVDMIGVDLKDTVGQWDLYGFSAGEVSLNMDSCRFDVISVANSSNISIPVMWNMNNCRGQGTSGVKVVNRVDGRMSIIGGVLHSVREYFSGATLYQPTYLINGVYMYNHSGEKVYFTSQNKAKGRFFVTNSIIDVDDPTNTLRTQLMAVNQSNNKIVGSSSLKTYVNGIELINGTSSYSSWTFNNLVASGTMRLYARNNVGQCMEFNVSLEAVATNTLSGELSGTVVTTISNGVATVVVSISSMYELRILSN